jgi:hypothetical protein
MKSAKLTLWMAMSLCAAVVRGDQLVMQNGDHYSGKVISMTAETVVLQSDVLGKISIPRSKVSAVHVGAAPIVLTSAAPSSTPSTIKTSTSPELSEALRNLGANTNFVEQVRKQFLADAGPEANAKYDELVGGLMSGKIDMNAIRAQAKSAVDQIRALQAQGGDTGGLLDSYLTILDSFLKDTPVPISTSVPVTRTNYGTAIIR